MSVWLSRRLVLLLLRRIEVGSLIVVEGGERLVFGSGSPTATVQIASSRTWPKLLRGNRGMVEAFAQGLWNSPDLVALIRLAARNAGGLDRLRTRLAPVRWPLQRTGTLLRRSTTRRRRRDIAAHYDLGNELFARMLDPTMSYSCALFEHEGMTLEQAQVAKLERICEQLDLAPGDRVLEIGTGWGGFALHAAATRGCHVTTTTISREQHDYALEQVRRAGLSDRVTVLMEDYCELRGRYDKLVSIEMIEAVGWRHFGTYFAKCSELLTPDGAMLLQAITIDDRGYEVEKASKSFINTYIFPGGCLPSLEVISRNVARRTNLQAVGPPGPDAALRRDAPALAQDVHRQRPRARGVGLRRALPPAVDALPRLLRSRLRGAADLRRPAAADQAPVPDHLTHVPDSLRPQPAARPLAERMINSLLDDVLDRTVVAGFTNVGYRVRSRGWRASELQRMRGKVVLVTGASSGLGLAAAEGFARLGATVWLVARRPERGEQARATIVERSGNGDVHVAVCDLSELESVRQFAGRFRDQASRLDVLVNNAGVMTEERAVSADGIELTLATNVVGPFLLTNLLIPLLRESAPARIINVSSGGMYTQKLRVDDLQSERGKFDGPKVYARTKRAEVILTELWAEQLAGTGVVVHAMHPGWADTPGVRSSLPQFYTVTRPLLRTPEQGADTIVWLGAASEPGRSSGRFWHDRRPRPTHVLPRTRETPQERERLLAECIALSGWHEPSIPTASTSIPEGES